ncbi:MAG: TolC family protein [Planctomycetota bacterium]
MCAGLLAVATAAGCVSIDTLDEEARRVLADRGAGVLTDLQADPEALGLLPDRPSGYAFEPSAAERRGDPPTTNPGPDGLPAETDPSPSTYAPELLDAAASASVDLAAGLPLEEDPTPADARRLDLEGLLAIAIERSPDYRAQKEQLFLSSLSLLVEQNRWGPRFFNTVSAGATVTRESGDDTTAATLLNEFQVTQRLPWGGQASVSALVDYTNILRDTGSSDEDESFGVGIDAEITLPLLRDAGPTARNDLIQAERDVLYAARDFERFRRELLVDLAGDYFDLLRAQREIGNRRQQVAGLERLAARFEALAQAGREPPFEAERARQQVLFGESRLVDAEESYAANLDRLKLQIGLPVDTPVRIEEQVVDADAPELDSVAAVRSAWAFRLDLQTLADRVQDARRELALARNQTLPDLEVFGRAAADPEDDDSGLTVDLEDQEFEAGVRFGAPLDRVEEVAAYRTALVDLERSRRTLRLGRDQVALDVRRTVRQIEQARFNVRLQQRNVELADRRLLGVRLRETELGPEEVIDAVQDRLDAQNERDAAIADLRTGVLQYLLDTGQMRVGPDGRWRAPIGLSSIDKTDGSSSGTPGAPDGVDPAAPGDPASAAAPRATAP